MTTSVEEAVGILICDMLSMYQPPNHEEEPILEITEAYTADADYSRVRVLGSMDGKPFEIEARIVALT